MSRKARGKKMGGPRGTESGRGFLSIGLIEELKRKGYNQSEIASMFDVTPQAITYHKTTYNGTRTPREEVLDHFPFEVPEEQCQSTQYRRLRDHGEYMATGGKSMSQDKLQRLRSFYAKLRKNNLVVEFDPTIPPEPGVCKTGGFAYRPRRKSDRDLLIRVNEYTHLTEQGGMIWRFPPADP